MRPLRALLIGSVAFFFLAPFRAPAEIYKWVDKKGRVHYTDNPDQLPEPQRSKALRELEEKLKKERERRERLKEQGIKVPPERLPPPPLPPPDNRPHPATQRLKKEKAAKARWQAKGKRARERVSSLEKKCEELKTKRDQNGRDRLTYARPGANQRYQEARAAYERCREDLKKARHYLEVELPEEARRSGVPPGWIR